MRYDKMLVWQKSMQLTELTYLLVKNYPEKKCMNFPVKCDVPPFPFLPTLPKDPEEVPIMI